MSEWSDWIEHDGKGCPVSPETPVIPGYRAGADPRKGVRMDGEWPAGWLAWWHDGQDDDIVRYRKRESTPEEPA